MPTLRRTVFNPEGSLEADDLDLMQERANARAQEAALRTAAINAQERNVQRLTAGPAKTVSGGGRPAPSPAPGPAPVVPGAESEADGLRNQAIVEMAKTLGMENPNDPIALEVARRNAAADMGDKSVNFQPTWRATGPMGTRVGLNPAAERRGYTLPDGVEGGLSPVDTIYSLNQGKVYRPSQPTPDAIAPVPGMPTQGQMKYNTMTPDAPPIDRDRYNALQAFASGEKITEPEMAVDPDAAFERELKQKQRMAGVDRVSKALEAAIAGAAERGDTATVAKLSALDLTSPEAMTVISQALAPTPVEREARSTAAAQTAQSGFTFQNEIQNLTQLATEVNRGSASVDQLVAEANRIRQRLVKNGDISPEQAQALIRQHLDNALPGRGTDIGITATNWIPFVGPDRQGPQYREIRNQLRLAGF